MAKVMVVDDAYSELKLMEGILKSAGLEVVCFPDGDQLEAQGELIFADIGTRAGRSCDVTVSRLDPERPEHRGAAPHREGVATERLRIAEAGGDRIAARRGTRRSR